MALFTKSQFTQLQAIRVTNEDGTLDPNWFIDNFQKEDTTTYGAQVLTFAEVETSIQNSERFMEQFPLDPKAVKVIAHSLYLKGKQLLQMITLNILTQKDGKYPEGTLLIEGGRNRTEAIIKGVNEAFGDKGLDFSATRILATVREATTLDVVKERIVANNGSRKMRPVEQLHMTAQTELNMTPGSCSSKDFNNILSRETMKDSQKADFLGLLGYNLTKGKNTMDLKPETLKTLFKLLSSLLLDNEDFTQVGSTYIAVYNAFYASLPGLVDALEVTNIGRGATTLVGAYYDTVLESAIADGVYEPKQKGKKATKSEAALTDVVA